MFTLLLLLLMHTFDVFVQTENGQNLSTVRTVRLLIQMDTLYMVVHQLLDLKLLLTVVTLVVPDSLMDILDVVVEVLVLLVADGSA